MFFAYFCLIKISKRIVVKKRETLGLNKGFFFFFFFFLKKKKKKKKKIHVRWAHEYITHRGSWCWHIQKTFDEIRNNHILKFGKNKTQKSNFLKKTPRQILFTSFMKIVFHSQVIPQKNEHNHIIIRQNITL